MKKAFGIIGGAAGALVLIVVIAVAVQSGKQNRYIKDWQTGSDSFSDKEDTHDKEEYDEESDKTDAEDETDSGRETEAGSEADSTGMSKERAYWEKQTDAMFAPSGDELDNRYDSDYYYNSLVNSYDILDSKGYDTFFGSKIPTAEDVKRVCDANPEISQEFKDFIATYARDWLALYPKTDFRPFCKNLETLKVIEATESEIIAATAAVDAAACYLRSENAIYVLEGTDFSKGTDGYIILTHELTHAARICSFETEQGETVRTDFYKADYFGSAVVEGIQMRCAYEMQGYEAPNRFYLGLSNFFIVLFDCLDYDGADYINHSVTYFSDVLDAYMDEEGFGRKFISLLCANDIKHYQSYREVPYEEAEFDALYEGIVRIYMKKYLKPEMSMEEAEAVYQDFIDIMMLNFLERDLHIYQESNFRPAFENCCKELGIKE